MMDTVLNLGLNDETVEALARKSGDQRFAYDCYRRFITMYSDVVLGFGHHHFEEILDDHKDRNGYTLDTDLSADDWVELVQRYKERLEEEHGEPFPQDPHKQLWGAIGAVFGSWMNQRAITYRRLHNIPESWGTAVNVQAMVFGNMGDDLGDRRRLHAQSVDRREAALRRVSDQCPGRGRGRGHSHAAGDHRGRAQGIRLRQAVDGNRDAGGVQGAHAHLRRARAPLPRHAGPRIHRRAGQAVDAADPLGQAHRQGGAQGSRSSLRTRGSSPARRRSRASTPPRSTSFCIRPSIPMPSATSSRPGCRPRPARRRARSCSRPTRPRRSRRRDKNVILVRVETSPEDIHGMHAAEGILTTRGGMTSHAAVVARGMGKPCVSGAGSLRVDYAAGTMSVGGHTFKAGRRHHHRRLDRPGAGGPRADDRAGAVGRVRDADGLGRQGAQARRARQCRHAERCARGAEVRRRGHRALPHRAHVLRRGPHPRDARDDPRRRREISAAPRSPSSCRCSARISSSCSRSCRGCRSRSGCSTRRCTNSCRTTTRRSPRSPPP